jgi:hypothetical protein
MRYLLIPISAIILFFPAGWLFSKVVGNAWGSGIAAFVMYIWYPYMAFNFLDRNKSKVPDVPDMAQALASGDLEVSNYVVRSVIEIEEIDDEGMFFLLDVGENLTLCLRGQYLYESTENGLFPASEIKVFWNKSLGFTYGVQGAGDKLEPTRVLLPLTGDQWDLDYLPEDRELINKNINKVVKDIEESA